MTKDKGVLYYMDRANRYFINKCSIVSFCSSHEWHTLLMSTFCFARFTPKCHLLCKDFHRKLRTLGMHWVFHRSFHVVVETTFREEELLAADELKFCTWAWYADLIVNTHLFVNCHIHLSWEGSFLIWILVIEQISARLNNSLMRFSFHWFPFLKSATRIRVLCGLAEQILYFAHDFDCQYKEGHLFGKIFTCEQTSCFGLWSDHGAHLKAFSIIGLG